MTKLKTNEVELIQSRFETEHKKVKILLALVQKMTPGFPTQQILEKTLEGRDLDDVVADFFYDELKEELRNG